MPRARIVRIVAAAAVATLVTSGPLVTGARRAGAAFTRLPVSPAGTVSVLEANVNELLSGADIAETRDMAHFAYRVQAVLAAWNARAPSVLNYAPDVVFLSEATAESADTVAHVLSSYLQYTYLVGAAPSSGTNAWTSNPDGTKRVPTPSSMGETHETAILYNADTMNAPADVQTQGLGYGFTQINTANVNPDGTHYDYRTWLGMRQSLAVITEKGTGGKKFALLSMHFRPNPFLKDPDLYKGAWTKVLKDRMQAEYPNVAVLAGGDLNMTPCYVATTVQNDAGYAGCSATTPRSAMWTAFASYGRAYHPAFDTGIDHIFTTQTVLVAHWDSDYKTLSTTRTTYFAPGPSSNPYANFAACHNLYNVGQGGSAAAAAIQACTSRYYSDHDFRWAIIR